MPAPVLDCSAYPHILDAVVSYAPFGALVALRATCRDLRRRADARLFVHAQLHAGRRSTRTVNPGKPQPAPLFLSLPARTSLAPPSGLRRLPAAPNTRGLVHTLDIDTATGARVQTDAFPNLHTLRRVHTTQVITLQEFDATHTVVDYLAVPRSPRRYDVCFTLPAAARRSVLHVSYVEHGDALPPRISVAAYNSYVDDFTFVFRPAAGVAPDAAALAWQYDAVYYAVAYCVAPYTVTVAGWEKVSPRFAEAIALGSELDDAREAERTAAREYFEQQIASGHLLCGYDADHAAQTIYDRLRVLTLDEWHAELGDRRELEGDVLRLRDGSARTRPVAVLRLRGDNGGQATARRRKIAPVEGCRTWRATVRSRLRQVRTRIKRVKSFWIH